MPFTVPAGLTRAARRTTMFLAAAAAAIAMYFAATAPSASATETICWGAYLAPYGQNGDRCWGPGHSDLLASGVVTNERAGCVDIADGSNNLMQSWVCGAAGSAPGTAAVVWDFSHEGMFRKGVVRNNNSSFWAWFNGNETCGSSC